MRAVHGEFSLQWAHTTCATRIFGAFNALGAQRFDSVVRQAVAPRNGAPWAALTDLRQFDLSVEDTMSIVHDTILWCVEHSMQRAAVLVSAKPSEAAPAAR